MLVVEMAVGLLVWLQNAPRVLQGREKAVWKRKGK